jgi:hypothetical protein
MIYFLHYLFLERINEKDQKMFHLTNTIISFQKQSQ